jgi:predicted enzyme related to lactoylglutathione lyase
MSNNVLCWIDIPVKRLDRAIRFYSSVLGEDVTRQTGDGYEFGLLPHAQDGVSGCLYTSDDNRPSEYGPILYLSVEGRLDAAVQACLADGGRLVREKHPIGPYGYRAIIIDSEGNRIALHSYSV